MQAKKQPKAMFYVPGIVCIGIAVAVLGIETPDRTIRFGADFYTEAYQAIAEIAYIIKMVMAYLLFALGALSLGKGMTEAKRSDLVLEELAAIRAALEVAKTSQDSDIPVEETPEFPQETVGEPAMVDQDGHAETLPEEPASDAAHQADGDLCVGQATE